MLSGWWRSRQVRALARNRAGTISPAGQPRAGSGASGSRKWASSAAAPAGSRLAVSSTMTRACCHEIVPACSAARVSGNLVVRAWTSASKAPRRPFADRQDTRDLRGHGHLLGRAVLRGRRRRRHGPGGLDIVRGQQHLQRSQPGFPPGHAGEPVQAIIRQIPQRIAPPERTGIPDGSIPGRIS